MEVWVIHALLEGTGDFVNKISFGRVVITPCSEPPGAIEA